MLKGYEMRKDSDHCLECGCEFEYKRKGKIFCDDICRSRYHNRTKNWVRHYHSKVIGALERNCSILATLLEKEITSAEIGDLTLWGYNIEYATSVRKSKSHIEYRCFEYKFYRSEDKIYGLERVTPDVIKR